MPVTGAPRDSLVELIRGCRDITLETTTLKFIMVFSSARLASGILPEVEAYLVT